MSKRLTLLSTLLLLVLLAACGSSPTPTLTQLPPTWTPTPIVASQAAAATQAPATPTPLALTPLPAPTDAPAPTATPLPTDTPLPPTPTPVPQPMAEVTNSRANLRSGPGTVYDRTGAVNGGERFAVLAQNPAGDWWQIEVNGQPQWIYGELVQVSNAELVPVAADIPPTPVRPTATPVPPTPTPAPSTPDPCAGIGGDGCKFKLRAGPAFAANGGAELKLTLAFVHGGRGDEAQGSYFVWLEKDGAKLPVPDSVRSWTGSMRNGPNGPYNYEYVIPLTQIPGGNVAGNYTIWVLDGNGERDSQTFHFSVPADQGVVWITFDQN